MPGRNDLCPCGSGKKYKKCHGLSIQTGAPLDYVGIRRLEGEASELLLRYAIGRFGERCIEDAWEDFRESDELTIPADDPEHNFFLAWFAFGWCPEYEESLTDLCLADDGQTIHKDLRRFMEATISAPFSFYQAIEVVPGLGMTLRDILRKREVHVTEQKASTLLKEGHVIFTRVVTLDGVAFLMGCGNQVILPMFLEHLVDIRAFIEKEGRLDAEPEATELLLDLEEWLRDKYFELAEVTQESMTNIRNMDGDPLAFCKLRYSIPAFEPAFYALKDLEQKVTHAADSDLRTKGEAGEDGIPIRARIHWQKRRKGQKGEYLTIATMTLSDTSLLVEVNSEKRSKLVQSEIEKRLGKHTTLLNIDITPGKALMKKAEEEAEKRGQKGEPDIEDSPPVSPEMVEFMKRKMEEHWKSWPDMPVPALKGMTPRQASKSPIGRELLESLLLDFETRSASRKDKINDVDVDKLRRELGMKSRKR